LSFGSRPMDHRKTKTLSNRSAMQPFHSQSYGTGFPLSSR